MMFEGEGGVAVPWFMLELLAIKGVLRSGIFTWEQVMRSGFEAYFFLALFSSGLSVRSLHNIFMLTIFLSAHDLLLDTGLATTRRFFPLYRRVRNDIFICRMLKSQQNSTCQKLFESSLTVYEGKLLRQQMTRTTDVALNSASLFTPGVSLRSRDVV